MPGASSSIDVIFMNVAMKVNGRFVRALLFFLFAAIGNVNAHEPWADERLTVRDPLLFWLDASVQPTASEYNKDANAPLEDGARVSRIYDASGNSLHFTQSRADSQPVFQSMDAYSFWRFDGIDDFLTTAAASRTLDEFTVMLVASPHTNTGGFRSFLSTRKTNTNDYQTGLNLDMVSGPSAKLQVLNVEGSGLAGQSDLLAVDDLPLAEFRTLEFRGSATEVTFLVDGRKFGSRSRDSKASEISLEEIALGSRLTADFPSTFGMSRRRHCRSVGLSKTAE